MINVLFVCHGNICRSPMAESVFTYLLRQNKTEGISVASAATHCDELGNPPYYAAKEKLKERGIPLVPHRARLMTAEDGERFDYLIGMDDYNIRDMKRIVGVKNASKVFRLLDFTSRPRPVADPWYTRDFDAAFDEILEGARALLRFLTESPIA